MTKHVTFVNTNQVRPAIAPIAFDYLSGPLMKAGYTIDLLDLCFSDDFKSTIADYCKNHHTDFWGVTFRNTDDTYFAGQHSFLPLVQEMVQTLKQHSDVPVVLGGVGFSIMPEKIMALCDVDFGITCEGEVSFPRLLNHLSAGSTNYSDVSGLVYRTANGFVRNPVIYADPDEIGAHSRDFLDNVKYFNAGGQIGIETKRGCSRPCIYCVEPLVKGRKVRLRKPSDIVDEMENLLRQGINVFHINDSEFNLDVKHAIAFCEEIRQRQLEKELTWYAYGMPTPLPDLLVKNMVESGCVGLNIGADSASEKMIKVLKRTFRPHHLRKAIDTCKKYNLETATDLLFGAPGETAETVRESIEFVREIDIERVIITLGFRVFANTELEDMVRAEGITPDNPNLYGVIEDNDDLAEPLFYLSSQIAPDPFAYVAELVGDDERFFGLNTEDMNYNANDLLVDAVARGERGAYWSILSKIEEQRNLERKAHQFDVQ